MPRLLQVVDHVPGQTRGLLVVLRVLGGFLHREHSPITHARVGNEDTIIDHHGRRFSSVEQIKQTVRIAHELGREIASGKEAREIYRIGVQYNSIEETLIANGMAPNRKAGQKGVPQRK